MALKVLNELGYMTKKKGKKQNLRYALEVCDRVQVTTIISRRGNSDGNNGLDMMNCLQQTEDGSPLQGAVSLGHHSICQHLVEEGMPSFSSSSMVPHPLCLALQKGHSEISGLLISAGGDVNLTFGDYLPMFFALNNKDCEVKVVKQVINAGFPKNGVVNLITKETTLHVAVSMNHLLVVQYLISISVNVNVKDKKGLTPLHVAVQKENPAMIDMLVRGGAHLNSENKNNYTPLFYAIVGDNCEILKLLLSLGADIHHANSNKTCSMMPLHFAAFTGQLKVIQLLLEKGAEVNKQNPNTGEIALHSLARADPFISPRNKISLGCIAELLIRHESDVRMRDKFGLTPLQVAVKAKNVDIAKLLITKGSELNNTIKNRRDSICTTFHLISKMANKELISLALEYGADCMVKDGLGFYPCHLALMSYVMQSDAENTGPRDSDGMEVFKLYWKQNFPYDLTFKVTWRTGKPPCFPPDILKGIEIQNMLFEGVKSHKVKLVEKALSLGAEAQCCSSEIEFPLHYLASTGSEAILKLFLSQGVVVNTLNSLGETPLHSAARAGNAICCQLLLEYGAVYNYKSPNCPQTPLQVAKEQGHTKVVSLLKLVDKYFKLLKTEPFKNMIPDMINAAINCTGRDRLTLLGRALKYDLKETAQRLMQLRISNSQ